MVSTRILILDACRDNPLGRTESSGLAPIRAGSSTFIAYSTEPGTVANDGDEKSGNSPYTGALVAALKDPAPTIEETFRSVRAQVMRVTNQKQIPWESSSLTRVFSFRSEPTDSRAVQVQDTIEPEAIKPSVEGVDVPNESHSATARRKQIYDRIVGEQEVLESQIEPAILPPPGIVNAPTGTTDGLRPASEPPPLPLPPADEQGEVLTLPRAVHLAFVKLKKVSSIRQGRVTAEGIAL
jgi:hypothetical protein